MASDPSIARLGSADIAFREIQAASGPGDERPVLVFLHEGLGCIGMWKDFPDALVSATGCHALIYDRPGHGASGPESRDRDKRFFDDEAHETLPALLSHLGISNPILIGHSDGGTIALLYAGAYPVRGLVTEAAHVFVEPESLDGVAAAKLAWRDPRFRERLARYHGAGTAAMFDAWSNMWSAEWFRDWNIEDKLAAVACPLLVIQGRDDEYGTDAQVEAIVRGVSGPVSSMLASNCGHAPHIQARQVVLARMAEFIRGLVA